MALRPLRQLPPNPEATAAHTAWLGELEDQLSDTNCDRNLLCRDTLYALYHPGARPYDDVLNDPTTSAASRCALLALDPRHITLEPEYYAEIDVGRYAKVKPLLWLWQQFDRSPLGGGNVALGVALRRLLAQHIFKRCGKNFKCFQFVEFSYGYNMDVGDNVVVHRHVLLDDRGGIVMGDRVSVADYANIYSHTHSIVDQVDVTNATTILDAGTRITYHATVLAGVHVGAESMVGACAVATRDVRPYHVNLGVPAKSVRVKPNAPSGAGDTLDTARQREVDR